MVPARVHRVSSNTIVYDDHVLIGAPMPWELQILRQRPMLTLPKLLAVTRQSPEEREASKREVFDAETWAFVHFLMFGDEGARAASSAPTRAWLPAARIRGAFAETLGPVEPLEVAFRLYYQRDIFSYRRVNLDVSVERERFPCGRSRRRSRHRLRALFHAAMRRPVEARAAIAEARKADPNAAGSYVAEGLLADQDSKPDEAKVAYRRPPSSAPRARIAYYRLAQLTWQPNPSNEVFTAIEQH